MRYVIILIKLLCMYVRSHLTLLHNLVKLLMSITEY